MATNASKTVCLCLVLPPRQYCYRPPSFECLALSNHSENIPSVCVCMTYGNFGFVRLNIAPMCQQRLHCYFPKQGETMVTIRSMLSDEWMLHREVRLQSLLDSPHAFGSTYASEVKRSDDEWQNTISSALASGHNHVFLAEVDAVICGLVWCKLSTTDSNLAEVFQMWVHPKYRGASIGQQLLKAAIDCADQHGASVVRLEVSGSNLSAMAFYQSQGFQAVNSAELQGGISVETDIQTMKLELT